LLNQIPDDILLLFRIEVAECRLYRISFESAMASRYGCCAAS
jgi:hypothetical protein